MITLLPTYKDSVIILALLHYFLYLSSACSPEKYQQHLYKLLRTTV